VRRWLLREATNSGHPVTWGNQWFGKRTGLLSATYLPHIVKHTARAPQPYTGTALHWRNGSNYQVSTVVRKWLNWYFGHTTPNLRPSGEYISAIASMPFTLRILSILTAAERRAPKDPRGGIQWHRAIAQSHHRSIAYNGDTAVNATQELHWHMR
jgi:hypothetical protein